jgi:hypothetical protein
MSYATQNAEGDSVVKGNWVLVKLGELRRPLNLPAAGTLVDLALSVKSQQTNGLNVTFSLCFSAAVGDSTGTPITIGGQTNFVTATLSTTARTTVHLSGIVKPTAAGTWYVSPCITSNDATQVFGGLGWGIIIN